MKKVILLFILLAHIHLLLGQNQSKIDSLTQVIEGNLPDTIRLEAYKLLAYDMSFYDSAKTVELVNDGGALARKLNDKASELDLRLCLIDVLITKGNYTQAQQDCKAIIDESKQQGFQKIIGLSLNYMGYILRLKSEYDEALTYYQGSLEIREKLMDKKGQATAINNIAQVYHIKGDHAKALQMYQQALQIREGLGEPRYITQSRNNVATMYSIMGKYDSALLIYQQSLKIQESIGDKFGLAGSLNSIGAIHHQKGEYQKALSYYQQSLKIFRDLNHKSGIIGLLINIGMVHENLKLLRQAVEYFSESLLISTEIGDANRIASSLHYLGFCYAKKGDYVNGLKNLFKSYEIRKELGVKRDLAVSQLTLANVYIFQGDIEKALKFYHEALETQEELGDAYTIEGSLNVITQVYEQQEDYKSALVYQKKALKIAEKLEAKDKVVRDLKGMGWIFFRLYQEDSALIYYNQAIELCKQMGYKKEIRSILKDIGGWYTGQGQLPKALDFYYRSLSISEELQDTLGVAYLYQGIAKVHDVQQRHHEALNYHQKAFQLFKAIDRPYSIVASLTDISRQLLATGRLNDARLKLTDALSYNQQLGDSCSRASITNLLGKVYSMTNSIDSAKWYFQNSLALSSKCKSSSITASNHVELGKLHLQRKSFKNAGQHFEQALNYAQLSQSRKSIVEASEQLYQLYKSEGRSTEALRIFEIYHTNKDSLFNEENTRSLVQKEMAYAYEKEQHEKAIEQQQKDLLQEQAMARQRWVTYSLLGVLAALLIIAWNIYRSRQKQKQANAIIATYNMEIEDKNRELSDKNGALAKLNQEKDELMEVVAHDLKSPLNNMLAMASLMKESSKDDASTSLYWEGISKEHERGNNLILNLMDLHAYEQEGLTLDFKHTNLPMLVSSRVEHFEPAAAKKDIELLVEVKQKSTIYTDMLAFSRIIDNLLSNAIKYSPIGKTVRIEIGDRYVIIQDEGIGFSEADKQKAFGKFQKLTATPTGGESSNGLGLAIVSLLANKLDVRVEIASKDGEGAKMLLSC
ncbi:MAG: tetratricopeptide repeat protein [Flammeovirgaceae bacterium]